MAEHLAVDPASVETANWRSSRYKHEIDGFIVDGDYLLEKLNKRTQVETTEQVWHDIVPPFEVPEGEGIPTLVNPDNPFYVWDRKPEQWHPCWFIWDDRGLTIIDMVTGEIIGHGTQIPAEALVLSCADDGIDAWYNFREVAYNHYLSMGMIVTNLIMPTKAEIISEIAGHLYWFHIAHGTDTFFQPGVGGLAVQVTAAEVAEELQGREPYILAFVGSCGAMDSTGPGTWSQAFTKNMKGHTVVGFKYLSQYTQEWIYSLSWVQKFYHYLGLGYSAEAAFEEAVVDVPEFSPYIDIYEGTEEFPHIFLPGEVKIATVSMYNPTSSRINYDSILSLGPSSSEQSFYLFGYVNKSVGFPITMPLTPGTYPVYLDVYVTGVLIAHYRAPRDVRII